MVADTLAQWYFLPTGNVNPALVPSARRGLRNGLTSSFGSICFASLILAIIKILREAMNKAQQDAEVRGGRRFVLLVWPEALTGPKSQWMIKLFFCLHAFP